VKTYGGVEVLGPPFLTSARDGGELLATPTVRFVPSETAPRYLLYRRLGEFRSRSGLHGEEKTPFPLPAIEPLLLVCPAPTQVSIPTELSRLFSVGTYS
jgi:hypothetical protein